jgi:hypothetical protein
LVGRQNRDPHDAARTRPITAVRQAKTVLVRRVHNDRLIDTLGRRALTAVIASASDRTSHDQQCNRGIGHHAPRQLGNRLVGVVHGFLTAGTHYDELPPANATNQPPQ